MLSDDSSQLDQKVVGKAVALLICVGALLVGAVLVVVYAANHLEDEGALRPGIVLPLIVIVGVIALLATLAIAASVFGLFKISDKSQALGLPAGSVQAVIALGLILIFAVVALYASSASGNEELTSTGLTQAQFEAIPSGEIVAVNRSGTGEEVTYEVTRSIEDKDLKDINLQLLTTVSTLVVAVAAFYFGSKSVQEGSKAVSEATAPQRSLSVTTPQSPYNWGSKPAGPLPVVVQSLPPNAQLRWSIDNDDGQLQSLGDGKFEYTPGKIFETGGTVTLKFEQVDDPSVSASLVINFEQKPAAPTTKAPEANPAPA